MSLQPFDASLILVPLLGLHVMHFVVSYYVNAHRLWMRRLTDEKPYLEIVKQELILRTVCHYLLAVAILWPLCTFAGLVLAAIATGAYSSLDYWRWMSVDRTPPAVRIFWARANINNLFFNILYGSLAVCAFALHKGAA